MAGFLIQQGAQVLCAHGGQAIGTAPNPRVLCNGLPTFLLSAPWQVAGCPLVPPPLPPCVTGLWVVGTVRVTSDGEPLAVQSGQGFTLPNGTPMIPVAMQTRVSAI
jgi:hypothetical protein